MIHILQGSALPLYFTVKDEEGMPVTNADVDVLEFCIGSLRKTSPEITFDGTYWMIPLSQSDTYSLAPGLTPTQCRVKLPNTGWVPWWKGCLLVDIDNSITREVL